MKKIAFYIFFIALFVLSSCQNEVTPPLPTPLECGDDEIIVDGTCQKVKSDFEKTFDATGDITNYTLTVNIQIVVDIYEIILEVDDDKSSFEIDGKKEYYEKTTSGYNHYYPVDASYRKESIDTPVDGETFHFFKDFEASWFQLVSSKYFLKSEYNDEVAAFFQEEFPGSTVSNLELIVGDTYFDTMIFDVTVGEAMYRFTMTLSAIGETTITLPSV